MQNRGGQDNGKDRPNGIRECAHANGRHGQPGNEPLRSRRIDQSATGHLARQRDETTHRKDETDFDLCPFLRRQIDRDERAETGLHVGEEKNEPVETAQTATRWGGQCAGGRLCRRTVVAVAADPVNRW